MTYVPRRYEEIVRDLLTTLTGGTVRETVLAPLENLPLQLPKLLNRPVRRISHLEGTILVGRGAQARKLPFRFTTADFELVSSTADDGEKDSIRFRENGRHPVPGSPLTVNYYPVQTNPVPLTDLNTGSVVRTLLETVAREMALSYLNLEAIYKSAFLDTAEGPSLDKVVALIGVQRLPMGHPVVKVQFSRRSGTPGRITIPAGTPVTDAASPPNRYLTLDPITFEPYESTRQVLAGGEGAGTQPVEAEKIDRLEVAIAGVSSEVRNPQPARRLAAPESDDELRRRARNALQGAVRGTVDAIRFGLLSVPGVKDVSLIEAPNGVPGEVRVEVAFTDDSADVQAVLRERIRELRPAGIRVTWGQAARKRTAVRVELVLAGTGMPTAELSGLTKGVEDILARYLADLPPGGQARRAKLSSLALQDPRIADARVILLPDGEGEQEELTLSPGTVLDVVRPFNFPPPTTEQAPEPAPATTAIVSLVLPVHLVAGVTQANAVEAITTALKSHLAARRPDAALTVDGLAAAIRDDTRFALVRAAVIATVESGGRFQQLTDGIGAYTPAVNETLQLGALDVSVREGGA